MKVSLCITVLNEEKSIGRLLESIFAGTKKPDEIVIVDGGSTDNTLTEITNYKLQITNKYPNVKFQIIKKGKTTIAKGRNIAIKNASGDVIVQTDAGCVVKKDWLEKITTPFINKSIDIVAGYYEMPVATPINESLSVYLGVPNKRFNPNTFIPSARSVAFRKNVWEALGGYNEKLKKTGEDTLFFHDAVFMNFTIKRVGEAQVIWQEIRNLSLSDAFKKFYMYAIGDYQSGIWWDPIKRFESHNIKVLFIFARYGIGLLLLVLGFRFPVLLYLLYVLISLYIVWPIYKWHDIVTTTKGRMWLPIVQVTSDFAVMAGFLSAIIDTE